MSSGPPLVAVVITCSDSVSAGTSVDRSGPVLRQGLTSLGYEVTGTVVPDDVPSIVAAIGDAVSTGARVVISTGGTGLTPRDVTPEAVRAVVDRTVPGIGEALRADARDRVPMADLSRSVAGTLGNALVVALPGSPGGASDGMRVLAPILAHCLAMLDGGGHRTAATPAGAPGSGSDHGLERSAHPQAEGATGTAAVTGTAGSHPSKPHRPHEPERTTRAATGVRLSRVSGEPIEAQELSAAVRDPRAGAIVAFEGRVRDHDADRSVDRLTYEAHPDAAAVMGRVLAQAGALPGVVNVAAAHRVGDLEVGELAFAVAASAPHREDAFKAATWLVDEIKERIPVWKKQVFSDGRVEWVNCA